MPAALTTFPDVTKPSTHDVCKLSERRAHRRLDVRMSVALRGLDDGRQDGCTNGDASQPMLHGVTNNVGVGGLYVELDRANVTAGDRLHVELSIPASEGVWPHDGRAVCTGEVVRVDVLDRESATSPSRCGAAVRFIDRPRFSF